MKRFVDVRGSMIGGHFAWFDTVIDMFEIHSDNMVWDTWEQFKQDYEGNEVSRYKGLTPNWAKK